MNSRKKTALTLVCAMCATGAMGQSLHESVAVEGKYVPDIIVRDRIYTYPKALEFSFEQSPLQFDERGVVAETQPGYLSLPAYAWNADMKWKRSRGYVDFALGSWLNSQLSAGGKFVDNGTTQAGAMLQFNSTSLYKPLGTFKREVYDGTLALYGSHRFSTTARLDGTAYYRLDYFNYPMFELPEMTESSELPTQTVNDAGFDVKYSDRTRNMSWYAGAALRYFGYRAFTYYDGIELPTVRGQKETRLSLDGGLCYDMADKGNVGFDGDLTCMFYSNPKELHPMPQSYGMLSLTPYYQWANGSVSVRAGARLDLTMNAGPEGERYGFFHIAPDVHLGLKGKGYGLSLDVTGGSELRTLSRFAAENRYLMPLIALSDPMYSPVNAALNAQIGPFGGFTFGAGFSYVISNMMPCLGFYPMQMEWHVLPYSELHGVTTNYLNLKGWSVHANMGLECSNWLRLAMKGSYQPQDGDKGVWNGFDRPRWEAAAKLTIIPMKKLDVNLSYDWRGGRSCFIGGSAKYDLPDISMLNLGATFRVTNDISIYGQVNNLLNRNHGWLSGPAEGGLNFLIGVSITF